MKNEDYALYEYDQIICVGKKYFIAYKTGLDLSYLHKMTTPSFKDKQSKYTLIKIGD